MIMAMMCSAAAFPPNTLARSVTAELAREEEEAEDMCMMPTLEDLRARTRLLTITVSPRLPYT